MKGPTFMKGPFSFVVLVSLGLLASACSRRPVPNLDEAAKAKVDAINRLADEMAKDPNGIDAKGALENFRITPMDAQKYPKEAQEVADIYRRRIQGKYKGPVAEDIQADMSQYLTTPGKK
jgi:hypothetical protein